MPCSPKGTTLKYEDGKLRMKYIGRVRFFFTMVANFVRGAIACVLCFYGTRFVGYTLELEDLLMNAVALEFVISVDEALFQALMPRAIKQFYDRLQPFRLPPFTSYRGVDLRGGVAVLAVTGVFMAALGGILIPQVSLRPASLRKLA